MRVVTRPHRRLLAASLALLCLGPAALHAKASSTAAGGQPAVLGFQSDADPPRLIDVNARAMTIVGVDGVNLIGPGRVSDPGKADLAQEARAHGDELPAVLLVGNWSPRINDFSERLAHQTLGNPGLTQQAATTLAQDAIRGGWQGVSVDLESLEPRDSAGLSAFVSELRAALPLADSLTVCIEAFSSPSAYRANGYDLSALATSASQIVLMTYDDHGPWENTPGPIDPLSWQQASVHALEQGVPPDRIFLGAANYGYAWRPHSNDNLTVAQARALVRRWHAHPRWVASVGEWTATLRDGSTLWWADRRAVALRLQLARDLGLHGTAVWSLGSGDPLPAPTETATPANL